MGIIVKASIKDQLYTLIKERILNQTYQLGEKINMLALSQELHVSNSPIREALSMLERDGLIVVTPNAGPSVIRINNEIFSQTAETIRILLIGGYDLCVEKELIAELIDLMKARLDTQREILKNNGSDFEFAQISIDFDMSILITLKNTKLQSLYNNIFDIFFLIVLYDHQNYDIDRQESVDEHALILDAIKQGNHEAVKKYINLHFNRTVDFN